MMFGAFAGSIQGVVFCSVVLRRLATVRKLGEMQMAKAEDRRVQRTRELLRGALFALIRERGFEELSVQDIIDRANVGRATFYAHFDNKDDLLLSGFDELKQSLKLRQREAGSRPSSLEERVFAFSHDLLVHASEHSDLFQAMVGKRSGAVVQQVMHKLLLDLVRDDVKAVITRAEAHAVPIEAVAHFVAGGLFGMMMWWLSGRPRLAAEELDANFRRLAFPGLKAALRSR